MAEFFYDGIKYEGSCNNNYPTYYIKHYCSNLQKFINPIKNSFAWP